MTPIRLRSSRAFTAIEVCVIIVILAALTAILYPVYYRYSQPHGRQKQSQCLSNEKQIGLALLGYAPDYDDTYPPVLSQMTLADGKTHEQQWSLDTSVTINGKQEQIPGLISAYCKTSSILQCPVSQTPNAALTYLYSDLAASESSKDFTEPASTVAFTDSEDHLRNVGHARSRNSGSDEAVFRPEPNDTAPKLLLGAVIGDASSRHSGGANYGFADGHAKLMWPDAVFFPPRTSDSRSHREAKTGRLLGPDPAGPRTFQGKTYATTFHVR